MSFFYNKNFVWRRSLSIAIFLAIGLLAVPVWSTVDDAHTAALEIADAQVKKGFKVREEHWSGKVKSGEKTMLKQQLFKGNEYWFWLGTAEDNVTMTIEIYDAKGKAVSVEKTSSNDGAGARVVPPSTGTYYVVFTMTSETEKTLNWSVAYGYR